MFEVGCCAQAWRRQWVGPPRGGRSALGRRRSASSRAARQSPCGSRGGCSPPCVCRASALPSPSRAGMSSISSAVIVASSLVQEARPQQVTDVGGQAVDLALLAVQCQGVTAALGHPEVAAESARVARRPGVPGDRPARHRPIRRARAGRSAGARRRRSPGSRRSRSDLEPRCRPRTESRPSCPSSTG